MSKLSDFLDKQKVDPRQLRSVSKRIEALRPEDRVIRLARTQVKKGGQDDEKLKETAAKKVRSGKPVSAPLLNAALGGKRVSAAAKSRITRAVNAVLEQKKKTAVEAQELF